MTGLISDIQRFSLHDGPGIRTTVFLKGCNLRCAWCHNPETLGCTPELQFDAQRCIACRACETACPQGAHEVGCHGQRSGVLPAESAVAQDARSPATADSAEDRSAGRGTPPTIPHTLHRALCTACGACARVCCSGALTLIGREMTPEQVLADIQPDLPFYRRSGGGVTLSGGEPLLQPDFAAAVLRLAKSAGIPTALETNLAVPFSHLAAVLPHTDLLMADLKVMDPTLHLRWTGASNDLILENARRLAALSTPLIVRTPVIPGVNDAPAAIAAIAAFLRDFPNLHAYELLPYHPLGAAKLRTLGHAPAPLDLTPPSPEHMAALAAVAYGFTTKTRRPHEVTKKAGTTDEHR